MHAVFRPGLRQHLHLHIGRLAALGAEIALDRLHLGQVQRQPPLPADGQQPRLVRLPHGDALHRRRAILHAPGFPFHVFHKRRRGQLVDVVALDHLVGQQPAGDALHLLLVQVARQRVAVAGGSLRQAVDADHGRAGQQALGHAVGHAGQQRHLHRPDARLRLLARAGLQRPPRRLLHHRIVQQFLRQPPHRSLIQLALQKIEVGDGHGPHAADAQRIHLPQQPQPACIRQSRLD